MKRFWPAVLLAGIALLSTAPSISVRAETETIDLKALAKKARPAVMLLVVSDATGKEIATGTGFLVSSDGKLITNFHVIENASTMIAKSENGGLFPVEGVLAADPKNDLVLLKLEGKDLPFLALGASEKIEVGTRIAVVGSPLGLEGTLSEGIISAVRELLGDIRLIQITAAISPGSSGSPVLNAKGEVIGVANSLLREGQALNFAVPIEYANGLLAKVKASTKPQPLQQLASRDEDAIFSDPDYRAVVEAGAVQDYVKMLKHAQALIRRYPENVSAHFWLGLAYGYLKFYDDAIATYKQAIKLKPDFAMAWNNLAVGYEQAGRTEDAIAACKQAIKLKPDYAEAWYNLGISYKEAGRTDDAIAAYKQAIKLKPDFAEAWYNLGVRYGQTGRTDEAIAAFKQAIKLKPDCAEAWNNLGVSYGQTGRTDDEIAAYKQAIKLKPDYAEAWYNLGVSYGQAGRTEDAIAALKQAIKLKPDFAEAWCDLGASYGQAGRWEDAIAALKQAIKLKPDLAEAWYLLGFSYRRAGRWEDAMAAFRRARGLKPELFK